MIPISEISRRLTERADGVCHMLLPGGRMVKNEFWTSGVTGGEGDSLKVHLTGQHAGRWRDWASQDDHGDLLDLWAAARGVSSIEALRQAKDYLGIHDSRTTPATQKKWVPAPAKAILDPSPEGRAFKWLTEVRKLSQNTIDAFKISVEQTPSPCVVFPSYSPEGVILNRSYRTVPKSPDEKKKVWQDTGCAPSLFGWHALTPEAKRSRSIVLSEGQIDAMTWHQWGIPALSIPNGSGLTWVDFDYENLEMFERIYLAFDSDHAGNELRQKAVARLGPERCYIVTMPEKDANDCLRSGRTAQEAMEWIDRSSAPKITGLVTCQDLEDRLAAELRPKPKPFTLPFLDLNWRDQAGFYFRSGEVTLWTGHSHAGKSTFLNYVMNCYLLKAPENGVFIGSFEVKPETTLRRMVTAMFTGHELDADMARSYLIEFGTKLVLADVVGFIQQDALFEMMRFAFRRYGISFFVIDSLMKVHGLEDDYPAQGEFINRLQEFAKTTGVHIHLVAHPRKPAGTHDKPGMMDIKGSSLIPNGVDNILTVCRNMEKADAAKEGELTDEQKDDYDTEIRIEKQKESGWMGSFFLKFDTKNYRYTPTTKKAKQPKQNQKQISSRY